MKPRAFLLLACLGLVAGFLALNVAARALLADVRLDATQDRLFTLSEGTRSVIDGLDETVTFDFHHARAASALDPVARAHARRTRELLRAYALASGGRIRLVEHDPAPFSPAEDAALAAGLTGAPVDGQGDLRLYLGLVMTSASGERRVLPFLSPERDATLEYDVTRALSEVLAPARPRIAVITGLPWLFSPPGPEGGGGAPVARVARALAERFDLTLMGEGFDAFPPDASAVLIAQPWALTPWQQWLLDQFALRRGRVLVMLDPASAISRDGGAGVTQATDHLGPLAAAWGFAVRPDVTLDRAEALPVRTMVDGRELVAPQPLYFRVPPANMNAQSVLVAGLARGLNVGAPGEVVFKPAPGLAFEPLLRTSTDTMAMGADRALSSPDPAQVLAEWEGDGVNRTIGLRVTGRLRTAFPDGPPPMPPRPPALVAAFGPTPAPPPPLNRSAGAADIVVVGDVDLLADGFYTAGEGEAADNAAFVLNVADVLTGAEGLIGLRSRAPRARPLRVVEDLRAAAQSRLVEEETRLQARLDDGRRRLADLEAREGGGFAAPAGAGLNAAEESELQRLRGEVVDTRRRLRAVQDGFRRDVETLKAAILVATGILVPFLAVLAGLWIAARRGRRRGEGAS
jgi:ABC-type uncharacterized transport system involved in gliding motility auxiliary subunit